MQFSDRMKDAIRFLFCLYARYMPGHWKKEGLIIRGSDFLHLNCKSLRLARLWFGSFALFNLADYVQKRIYYFGTHEFRTESLVWNILQSGGTMLDVGANIGIYSLLAAERVGDDGKIVAVEPVAETFQQMCMNMRVNGYDNVILCNKAAWEKHDEITMACPEENNCGTYHIRAPGPDEKGTHAQAVRLDDLVKEIGLSHVDLIKMDIEGAELMALKGAEEILSRSNPVLVLEVDPALTLRYGYGTEELIGYLKQYNYNHYAIGEAQAFYSKKGFEPDLRSPEAFKRDNYVFVPKARKLPGYTHNS